MPEGEVFKGGMDARAEEGPKKGEGGPEERESLPDEAPGGGPGENRGACVSVVTISTWSWGDGSIEVQCVQKGWHAQWELVPSG
jgi:hypothetical protein